jgi:hypothetical protein
MTVMKEISKYRLDSVGVQDVRWDTGGTGSAARYIYISIERE